MTDLPVRRRKFLTAGLMVVAFLAGTVLGIVLTTVLADRTSHDGLRGARALFALAQNDRLALAWNNGDMNEALVHVKCAYDAEFMDGSWWFDVSAIRLGAASRGLPPASEGMAHAKIAVVLERLGRADEARDQFAQAVKASGHDVNGWRALGLKTVGESSEAVAKRYGLPGPSR
jgi:hypothetical protein